MASTQTPAELPPNVIIFGPKGNCTLELCPLHLSLYGYRPQLAANGTFIALFTVAGIVHVFLGFRWREPFFAGSMVVGCLSTVLGYVGRIMLYYNPFNFSGFMLQMICITTSPIYLCAGIYVTLAKTAQHLAPSLSRFKPSLFYWIFLPADFFSLVIQAAGGALSIASKGTNGTGVNLTLAGLSTQVLTICIFCAFMGDFMYRYTRSDHGGAVGVRMMVFFGGLAAAIVLITVRCMYRLAELNQGYKGELVRHEVLFIVFEGVFVLVAAYCLMAGHPGLVFSRNVQANVATQENGEYLALEGMSGAATQGKDSEQSHAGNL